MSDRVVLEVHESIAQVRLNRPDKLNALDMAMFEALIETGERIAADRTVRVVVLSGEGRSFCAGLDFASFMAAPDAMAKMFRREPDHIANFAQRAAWVWREVPVPVIAAVAGHAYGGGLQLAAAADLRYATPDARLSIREIEWGLIPDMSGTQTLRHLLRHDVLAELTFSGRIVTGTEAHELGLVTRVTEDPMGAAIATAREIATKSPDAIRAAKGLLRDVLATSTAEGLARESEVQRTLLGGRNQLEAVAAGLAKRTPKFEDPR